MGVRPEPPQEQHLVLIHGGGAGPWMWRNQCQHFAGGYRVHTPALPGHQPGTGSEYRSHAHAARSIAEDIGLDRLEGGVTVVGFSMGGQVAIELAQAHPGQVERIVVVSSLLAPWRGARLLAKVSSAAAPLAKVERFARLQAKELSLSAEDFGAYFAVSRSMSIRSLESLLHANLSFTVPEEFLLSERPALLVAGSRERRTVIAGMKRVAARSNCDFVLVDGAGHDAPMTKPERFNSLLESWLAAHGAARRDGY